VDRDRPYGAVGVALAWLTGIAISQLLHFWVARWVLERPLAGVSLPAALVWAASLVGAATAVILRQFVDGPVGLAIAVLLVSCKTAILIWMCDRRFNLGLGAVLIQTFSRFTGLVGIVPGP
jgi:hypothetical protein